MTGTSSALTALPALVNTYATYPFTLERAAGEHVYDAEGTAYLDCYGGHCVCTTGHSHPRVVAATSQQLDKLLFYSNAAPLAIRDAAAAKMVEFAGAGMTSAFFCNSGSEANENALKAAVMLTGRKRFAAFAGSFHGRTLLSLSVTDSLKLRAPYTGLLADVDFLPLNDAVALTAADLSGTAAVIIEPVQSMAGVRVAEPAWLKLLRDKCTAAGTLLIFDEVQTGFGRLGSPFAANHFNIAPDMITLAKGIASGFPMGAVLFSGDLARRVKVGDFGSTFGGGPVACAALLATLAVIEEEELPARAREIEHRLTDELAGGGIRLRGLGLLLGLDAGDRASTLKQHLLANGILVGGSSDPAVLRLMPPLTLSHDGVTTLIAAINSFDTNTGELS